MRAARIPGRLSSCPPSLPLSLSGYPSFSSKPFDAARANLRGKRVAHEHVYIYIYTCVCCVPVCMYACVCTRRGMRRKAEEQEERAVR